MWVNARHTRRATGRGEQHAGTCKIVLTLTGDQINMRCASKVEPNPGFGEIGFFVPEAMLTNGAKASWTASPVARASCPCRKRRRAHSSTARNRGEPRRPATPSSSHSPGGISWARVASN